MFAKLSFAALAFTAGCYGTIDGSPGSTGGPGNPDGPDAAVGGGGGGGGNDAPQAACKNKVTANITSGHHNPGQDCMQGCHNHGFTLSGTLYAGVGSNTAVVGASITVEDANGVTFDMVTQQNGNFYTAKAVAFPVKVIASSCPDTQPMISTIAAGNGGCLKSGCHAAGGAGKIHLP